jgi:hypothetical protein
LPEDPRSLPVAHRVLAGTSVLAVLLIAVGSLASLIEIINAPATAFRWAAAAILVVVSLCWLVAALHLGPPWQEVEQRSARPHRTLGYLSVAMLTVGATLAGWNVRAGGPPEPAAAPPVRAPNVSASASPPPTTARIDSPANGAKVGSCLVDVRFRGEPAPGKAFVVAARNAEDGFYFETDLAADPGGFWTTRVQAGEKGLSGDERYTVSVYEHDKVQVEYLTGVVTEVEEEATYWSSLRVPPGMSAALDSVVVQRVKADPSCQT